MAWLPKIILDTFHFWGQPIFQELSFFHFNSLVDRIANLQYERKSLMVAVFIEANRSDSFWEPSHGISTIIFRSDSLRRRKRQLSNLFTVANSHLSTYLIKPNYLLLLSTDAAPQFLLKLTPSPINSSFYLRWNSKWGPKNVNDFPYQCSSTAPCSYLFSDLIQDIFLLRFLSQHQARSETCYIW